MDRAFSERVKALAATLPRRLPVLETEEATKNALVMPFLSALGYDVFDPNEVIPEYTADVGTKKGEKVDYAIKRGDEIVMIVEVKKASASLSGCHSSQLFRYFSVTKARIGILTNGVVYQFFTDLEKSNIMDDKPFLEIDLRDLKDADLEQLGKLSKDAFDLEDVLNSASDLKYLREIRQVLERQFDEPDEAFVRFLFNQTRASGRFTQSARARFSQLVKTALAQLVSDRVSDRLRAALAQEEILETGPETAKGDDADDEAGDGDHAADTNGIVTTEEELESFRIVRAILRRDIDPSRIGYKDSKSRFTVVLDGSRFKPICRLYLNRSVWYIGTLDEGRQEHKHRIEALEDIYRYADALIETAKRYDASKQETNSDDEARESTPETT